MWKVTSFATSLASMFAPTRRRSAAVPIGQSFYPTAEIKELFGEKLAYVDARLNSVELLDVCGITHRVNVGGCIKRLRQLKSEGGDKVGPIYRKLETLWSKEAHEIRQAFSQEALRAPPLRRDPLSDQEESGSKIRVNPDCRTALRI